VLLPWASELDSVDSEYRSILTSERLKAIVNLIPEEWLLDPSSDETTEQRRNVYYEFLKMRVEASDIFLTEAKNARATLI
jgi:hypothetical protein